MENHRTKFQGELKSSLKDDDLAPGGEDFHQLNVVGSAGEVVDSMGD